MDGSVSTSTSASPFPSSVRSALEGGTIRVSWDAMEGADHYVVYHFSWPFEGGGSCRLSLSGDPIRCEVLDSNVEKSDYVHANPDTTLYNRYWVVACNSGGCSEINDEQSVEQGPGTPDLVFEAHAVDDDSLPGWSPFTLSFTVRNQGDGVAEQADFAYYISEDPEITSEDREFAGGFVADLGPSESTEVTMRTRAEKEPGIYYYGVCLYELAGRI